MKKQSHWSTKKRVYKRKPNHSNVVLSPHYFSFSKILPQSAVSVHFELYMPSEFPRIMLCHDDDTSVILVTESGKEYSVKYGMKRNSLTCGLKEFVNDHRLRKGDTLSFQLTDPCKFKVHITRADRLKEDELQTEENACLDKTKTQKKSSVSPAVDKQQTGRKLEQATVRAPLAMPEDEPSGSDESQESLENTMGSQNRKRGLDEIIRSEKAKHVCIRSSSTEPNNADGGSTLNLHASRNDVQITTSSGIKNTESSLQFKTVKSFEEFKIQVNGKTLNSEMPNDCERQYYQLCCTQKRFLHEPVMNGRSEKLVVGMIEEIVNIAESMTDANSLTRAEKLETMRTTLKYFEGLGMTVGFLIAKIEKLIQISREYQTLEESAKKIEAEVESTRKAYNEKQSKIDFLMESSLEDEYKIAELETEESNLNNQKEKLRMVFEEMTS